MTDVPVEDHSTPEFHIVVRRRDRRGPLAPYRFLLAVGFAALVAGRDLLDALTGDGAVDGALVRAGVAAAFIWVLTGVVSRILAAGRPPTK